MTIHTATVQAKRAQSEGNAIYERLLPVLRERGFKAGLFIAINIASGDFVVAETRLDLMSAYKERFGQAMGWVRRID